MLDEDAAEPTQAIKPLLMAAMVQAALGGHDLGEWEDIDAGWQAECRGCGKTTWVGDCHLSGLAISRLEDVCGGETAA